MQHNVLCSASTGWLVSTGRYRPREERNPGHRAERLSALISHVLLNNTTKSNQENLKNNTVPQTKHQALPERC